MRSLNWRMPTWFDPRGRSRGSGGCSLRARILRVVAIGGRRARGRALLARGLRIVPILGRCSCCRFGAGVPLLVARGIVHPRPTAGPSCGGFSPTGRAGSLTAMMRALGPLAADRCVPVSRTFVPARRVSSRFGLALGSVSSLLAPSAFSAAWRCLSKGNGQTQRQYDHSSSQMQNHRIVVSQMWEEPCPRVSERRKSQETIRGSQQPGL